MAKMSLMSLRKLNGEHIFCQQVPPKLMEYSADQLEGAFAQNANTHDVLQRSDGPFGRVAAAIFDESGGWYADTAAFSGGRKRVMVPRLNTRGLEMIESQLDGVSAFGLKDEEVKGIIEINRRRVLQQKRNGR